MIDLYDSRITDILPEYFYSKPEVQALAFAISNANKKLNDYCKSISVYAAIDLLDSMELDLLALELNAQYYDTGFDVETKRNIIKNTLEIYRTASTPLSVEKLISAIFGECEVSEWFDYNGSPYFFKIKTNAASTPDAIEYFNTIIHKVKNARSRLESIEFQREIKQPYFAGVGGMIQYKPEPIIDGYDETRNAYGSIYASQAFVSAYKNTSREG